MKIHPGRWFVYTLLFLIGLLAIGAGPVGFAVLFMAGIPIGIYVAFEAMAHAGPHTR